MGGTILAAAEQSGGTGPLGPLFPEPYDIVWSLVIFVVILIAVRQVGLPRMNAMLDRRRASIEGNIEQAEAARREADEARDRYNAQLADARTEAGKIRDQARDDAKRIVAEARQQAQAEADRITAQQQVQIEANRAAAEQGLRTEVGTLALSLASAVVEQHLEDDTNARAYVERFLDDLRIEHAAEGSPQTGAR